MDMISKKYLDKFLAALPAEKRKKYDTFDAYHFCADEENANICASLVLKDEKRATAGLLWSYEAEEEALPVIGQLNVITNWAGEPQCVVETTGVEVRSFSEVDAAFAFEEGEGDKSLDHWKKEHWKFFSAECAQIGRQPDKEMPVVLERFMLVFRG